MRTAVRLTLALIILFATVSCAGMNDRKKENEREGEIHLQIGLDYLTNKGNTEMAFFELNKASRLIPRNPEVHFALGTIHLLRDETELAIQEFRRTVELDRHHADAYNNLGFAYLKLQRWDEAIESCSKALEQVNYDTPERAMTIMGWAYYKKGDTGRALDQLTRALSIRENQPDTQNKLATIYLEEGRLDKAKAILVNLVRKTPTFASARLNLGIIYFKERDVVAARTEFKAVLELVDQGSEEGRLARGYLDLIE